MLPGINRLAILNISNLLDSFFLQNKLTVTKLFKIIDQKKTNLKDNNLTYLGRNHTY